MPLLETFDTDAKTKLFIWNVDESLGVLEGEVDLSIEEQGLYEAIHNERGKKNFLATRLLLKQLGYAPSALYYDANGKPFLADDKHISISHSFDKVAVIISSNKGVGVDIEKKRDKIVNIAYKFTQWNYHTTTFSYENIIQKLIMIWCAKEVGFKAHGNPDITLNDIKVRDFFPNDTYTEIKVEAATYKVFFKCIEDFVLAYCHHK